jgi:hypothetical protein
VKGARLKRGAVTERCQPNEALAKFTENGTQ